MKETEHDIQVYPAWCNDETADLYVECKTDDVVLYDGTSGLAWWVLRDLVKAHCEES